MTDAVLRISRADEGYGIIARKRVRAITGSREPTIEDYHTALVQCLKDKAAEIERLRLTDAEREAVERAAAWMADRAKDRGDIHSAVYLLDDAAMLRGLLERTR